MRWYREIRRYGPQMMAEEFIEAANFLEDKMNQPINPLTAGCRKAAGSFSGITY